MADAAVIFDVDGVLLELTRAEEDAFFVPFERRYGLKDLSRDWNSYAIRNDEDIIAEILARHGLPEHEHAEVVADYLNILKLQLDDGTIETIAIPGALELLQNLRSDLQMGSCHRKSSKCCRTSPEARRPLESCFRLRSRG